MKLIALWRHGDPEGLQETEDRVARARRVIEALRTHQVENHLGQHLHLTFARKKAS